MRVFISWSGERSESVAEAFYDMMPLLIHHAEPWISQLDLEPGTLWRDALIGALRDTEFGIICLTPENVDSAWLRFEAAALMSKGDIPVVPFLLPFAEFQVPFPFDLVQHISGTREGTKRLMVYINSRSRPPVPEGTLLRAFERWWPDFESSLLRLTKQPQSERPDRRLSIRPPALPKKTEIPRNRRLKLMETDVVIVSPLGRLRAKAVEVSEGCRGLTVVSQWRSDVRPQSMAKLEIVGQIFDARIVHETTVKDVLQYGLELIPTDRERAFSAISHLIDATAPPRT